MNHQDDDDRDDSLRGSASFQQAKSALSEIGFWSKTDFNRFEDMWPELVGREDWVGRAITIARDKATGGKLQYALTVLANAIDAGTPPGGASNGKALDTTIAQWQETTQWAMENSPLAEAAAKIMAGYEATNATD